jgi:hypothetical protein
MPRPEPLSPPARVDPSAARLAGVGARRRSVRGLDRAGADKNVDSRGKPFGINWPKARPKKCSPIPTSTGAGT